MTGAAPKITLHVVSSLDGIIAKKDNSVSWFETADTYEKGVTVTEDDAAAFLRKIDCYVMGSHTYEHALELAKNYGWAYGDTPTIVLSQRHLAVERNSVELFSGDLETLVNERLKPNYTNVWVVGGAELVKNFLRYKLADEIRISVVPIILGDGLRLFDETVSEQALRLKDHSAYKNCMVEMVYEIKK